MYAYSCRVLTPVRLCCFSVVGPPLVFKTYVHDAETAVGLSTRFSSSHPVPPSKILFRVAPSIFVSQ